MATIHGIHGDHAQDLIKGGIISETPTGEHLVIVPITQTNRLILDLLDGQGVSQSDIVNFAGIMMTSPNAVPNLHFLFGPGATGDRKVAQAGNITSLVREILDRAEGKGIEVIETTRIQHDEKMAVIQGLSHLLLILIGKNDDTNIRTSLIHPWRTRTETIVDMIFANPFAEEIAIEFFDILPKHNHNPHSAFRAIVEKHLTEDDRKNFGTPNFERIMDFSGTVAILNTNRVNRIRKILNTRGRNFLRNRVHAIRSTPSPVPLSPSEFSR